MPCHAAMTDKVLSLKPEMPVEEALDLMKQKKLGHAAVVDKAGKMVGVFSINVLLKSLLPVSVAMTDGIQLDVMVRAAPGIAKRLKKIYPLTVEQIMERRFNFVYPQTPIWEGVNMIVSKGSPLFVVEGEDLKYMGMLTSGSVMDELQRMQEGDTNE